MDTNALQRAILHRFGPQDALVKLSELVLFLGSWETSQNAKTNAVVDCTTKTTPTDHRIAPKQKLNKRITTSASTGNTDQSGQIPYIAIQGILPQQPIDIAIPAITRSNPTTATPPTYIATSTSPDENQRPHQRPSYANIAKSTPEKALQPRKLKKTSTLLESVKLAPKALKPLKIALREPIKDLPNELILKIKERAVNGDRLASLIRSFRILTPKSLLVYANTKAVREELSQNTS